MSHSLHMVGDGDDLDVIVDVERTFGISILESEAEATRTVGELHQLIERHCAGRTETCLAQIAFHRLRTAVVSLGARTPTTPSTPITVLHELENGRTAWMWKMLEHRSGLELPRLEMPLSVPSWRTRWWHSVIAISLVVVTFAMCDRVLRLSPGAVLLILFLGLPALLLAAGGVLHLVFRDIPRRLQTIGDLAHEAAGCSFIELSRNRSRGSPEDRWFALLAILRLNTGNRFAIARDTTFFAQ